MTDKLIQALEAAALAATTGDWTPDDNFCFTVQCYRTGLDRLLATVNGPNAENDTRFIALASPQNIKRVLAERDADKALIAKSVVLFETLRQRIAELEAKTLTVKLPDSITCPTAPEIIWLQTNGDDSDESKWPESDDDVSWCREKIFTNDTLYVRADLAAAGITLVVGE